MSGGGVVGILPVYGHGRPAPNDFYAVFAPISAQEASGLFRDAPLFYIECRHCPWPPAFKGADLGCMPAYDKGKMARVGLPDIATIADTSLT